MTFPPLLDPSTGNYRPRKGTTSRLWKETRRRQPSRHLSRVIRERVPLLARLARARDAAGSPRHHWRLGNSSALWGGNPHGRRPFECRAVLIQRRPVHNRIAGLAVPACVSAAAVAEA